MPRENLFVLVNILYEELVDQIWAPSRIFTVTEKLCKIRIKEVIEKFIGYKHHNFSGGRDFQKKITEIEEFLHQLCDLAPSNLHQMLKNTAKMNKEWENDWQFYLNMCKPSQVGYIAGGDNNLAKKEKVRQEKVSSEEKRISKSASEKRKMDEVVSGDQFDGSEESADDLDDEEIRLKERKPVKKEKIILEIDPREINEQTVSTSDRLCLSVRQ